MLLGDEGDREAARGPGKPSLVLDETERLPCGKGSEGTLASPYGIPLEAKTRNRGRSSLASGGVTDNGKIPMLPSDTGDGEAARGPGRPSLVLDEVERLPCGKGSEGTLASSVRSKQRPTASTGAVCTDTRNLL